MADIPSLNVLVDGELAEVRPVNENFETLRVATNENTSDISTINEKIENDVADKNLSNITEGAKEEILNTVNADVTSFSIGDPIPTLSNTLKDNEIWLEGAVVSRETYAKLFEIYGTTYGAGDGSTTFALPDFRNRAIWGSNGFGYISAGLPNITGTFCGLGNVNETNGAWNGAFYQYTSGNMKVMSAAGNNYPTRSGFEAKRSNATYGKSSTVQPAAIKVRVKTRYK